MNKLTVDYTNAKFGEVTVICRDADHIQPSGRRRVQWKCQCSCGKVFSVRNDALKNLTSCGCKRNKENGLRLIKHADSRTRLYKLYYSMLQRCYNPKASRYLNYGGRGVEVCEEWKKDYTVFAEWAKSNGYDPNNPDLSLERIDVNGHYSPENCSWIPLKDQYNNRQNTIMMGNISLAEFCRQAKLDYSDVRTKYYRTKDIVYALGLKQ